MELLSFFKGGKYFDKNIQPKCDYCQFGRRTKDGNKVVCEKRGLVESNYSCGKFIYSPLKRIPVKQLNFVGSLADEDLYTESIGDIAEKELEDEKTKKENTKKAEPAKKAEEKPVEKSEEPVKEEIPETTANSENKDEPVEEGKSFDELFNSLVPNNGEDSEKSDSSESSENEVQWQ